MPLWVSSGATAAGAAISSAKVSGQDRVTIRLGVTPASVRIYDPTIGVEPAQTLSNTGALNLVLSDHPIVIAISPGGQ